MLNDAGCVIGAAGDVDGGVQLLEEAHKLAPDDANIGYNYARGLYQQGKVDESIKQINEVLKQKPDLDEARLLRASAAVEKKTIELPRTICQNWYAVFNWRLCLSKASFKWPKASPRRR